MAELSTVEYLSPCLSADTVSRLCDNFKDQEVLKSVENESVEPTKVLDSADDSFQNSVNVSSGLDGFLDLSVKAEAVDTAEETETEPSAQDGPIVDVKTESMDTAERQNNDYNLFEAYGDEPGTQGGPIVDVDVDVKTESMDTAEVPSNYHDSFEAFEDISSTQDGPVVEVKTDTMVAGGAQNHDFDSFEPSEDVRYSEGCLIFDVETETPLIENEDELSFTCEPSHNSTEDSEGVLLAQDGNVVEAKFEASGSGTSNTGVLSSESDDDLPNINISLPLKKRKRTKSCSSCEEEEKVIDYSNLKPEEIKALIEEAKLYGVRKSKCRCPKTKWADLPIKGPTEPSGKCTIGKGDWTEKPPSSCAACAAGVCRDRHKHRRRRRGPPPPPRLSLLNKARGGTIGEDVPIIDLSDSEDANPSSIGTSEVTITAIANECIVLSSSEDDDDIVCEGEVKATKSSSAPSGALRKEDNPDVVVLNADIPSTAIAGASQVFEPNITAPPVPEQLPNPQDSELWPDLGIDLENWLLANIAGPPQPVVTNAGVPPERPSTPEGWSCPICLEPKNSVPEIMSTTCGHVFCGECIRSAVKLHKKCPTCRKKLTLKQFHKIFL